MITYFDKGKPIATDNKDESDRLALKINKIDQVLKEMGYPKGYEEYTSAVNDMATNDFTKYMEFLKRIDS